MRLFVPLSLKGQVLLAVFSANLLLGIVFSDPGSAYEGIIEMFSHALGQARPPSEQLSNDYPAPEPPASGLNTWQPYDRGALVTAAAYSRLTNLKLPQRRETLDGVIGSPSQTNYASVYGYEDHPLWNGHLLEVTYEHGTDQRGQPGWVAIAVTVQ